MSGRKDGHLEDSLEAMSVALRRAAELQRQAEERRREELRRAAEKRFLDGAAALESQWKALGEAGYAALAGYALAELGRQRSGLARRPAGDIDSWRQSAEERDALIAHAVQTLQTLGERGRAGALAALPEIRTDDDLRGAIAQTLAAGSAVETYQAVLLRAREGLAFLSACEIAKVPLGDDVMSAKVEVERFFAKPTLAAAARTERVIAQLRPAYLEERLRARRQALLQGVEALSDPARRPLLEAWREGFADALGALRASLAQGDWQSAAGTLRELDPFLDARAEGRVRLLMEAARQAGFQAAEPTKTSSSRWTTSFSDQTGQLFSVSEAVPQWQGDSGLDKTLEFRGPQNFDGPACVTAGLSQIAEQLRKQGVGLRIIAEEQQELPLAPLVGPKQTTPQRRAPKLQQ